MGLAPSKSGAKHTQQQPRQRRASRDGSASPAPSLISKVVVTVAAAETSPTIDLDTDESYQLLVQAPTVTLTAATAFGAIRGLETCVCESVCACACACACARVSFLRRAGCLCGGYYTTWTFKKVGPWLPGWLASLDSYIYSTCSPWLIYDAVINPGRLSQYMQSGGPVTSANVTDAPRFAYRGLMVDPARRFLPLALLHAVVDSMSYVTEHENFSARVVHNAVHNTHTYVRTCLFFFLLLYLAS